MIRILLADYRPLVRAGLQTVLQTVADLQLLKESSRLQTWPHLCRQLQADVLLVDANQTGLQIDPLLAEISTAAPDTHVLMMIREGQTPSFDLHKLLQTKGDSAILSDDPFDLWFDALRTAGRGIPWFSPRLLAYLLQASQNPQSQPGCLTDRELEVLRHVAQGRSNKQIARLLTLSHRTVESHLSNILDKLDVASRVEAGLWFQTQNSLLNKSSIANPVILVKTRRSSQWNH